MKKYIIGLSLVTSGFIIGFIFMSLLSMKASKIFTENIRVHYLIEQEALAVNAQKAGDFNKALIHYDNLVYAASSSGIRLFDTIQSEWSLLFPLASIVLQRIRHNTNFNDSQARIEGINRGKLAITLESLGRKGEAEEQYKIAAKLMGIDNIQKVKETARHLQENTVQNWLSLPKTPSDREIE